MHGRRFERFTCSLRSIWCPQPCTRYTSLSELSFSQPLAGALIRDAIRTTTTRRQQSRACTGTLSTWSGSFFLPSFICQGEADDKKPPAPANYCVVLARAAGVAGGYGDGGLSAAWDGKHGRCHGHRRRQGNDCSNNIYGAARAPSADHSIRGRRLFLVSDHALACVGRLRHAAEFPVGRIIRQASTIGE